MGYSVRKQHKRERVAPALIKTEPIKAKPMKVATFDNMKYLERTDEVYLVGGGPSLRGFNLQQLVGKHIIVINKAIIDLPEASYFITCDYFFVRKFHPFCTKTSFPTKIFVANLAGGILKEVGTRIVNTNNGVVYKLNQFDYLIKSRIKAGIGRSFEDFRYGGNSGFCALQLALLLGYKKIHLLGYDMTCIGDRTHYHEGYGKSAAKMEQSLQSYLSTFIDSIAQIRELFPDVEIISYSPVSELNGVLPYRILGEWKQ